MTTRSARPRRHLATSPFSAPVERPVAEYAVDDRVSHDTYGVGRVTGIDAYAVTVAFGAQRVRVTSPFSKMEKL